MTPSPNMDLAGLLDRAGISVKPLEWKSHETYSIAATPFGEYTVSHYTESDGSGWAAVFLDAEEVGHFPTDLIAMTACQTHFAERILSSLKAST